MSFSILFDSPTFIGLGAAQKRYSSEAFLVRRTMLQASPLHKLQPLLILLQVAEGCIQVAVATLINRHAREWRELDGLSSGCFGMFFNCPEE